MREDGGLFDLLKRALPIAGCLLLMGYFLSYAIAGPTGLLSWRGFAQDKEAVSAELALRAQEKAALQKQVQLLDPKGVDPDLADELVRRNLNVVKPDEVIVTFPDKAPEGAAE